MPTHQDKWPSDNKHVKILEKLNVQLDCTAVAAPEVEQ